MEDVFRALADPSRRLILDRLFERDGQTLTELCGHLPQMTRFGVMSHLSVLEAAALVTSHKVGREKRHYLNPVPIRLLHDRWTSKFAAPVVGAMVAIKQHLEGSNVSAPQNHVYVTYIRASTEQVWSAIVDGAQTERYYYGTRVESTWEVGAPVRYAEADGSVAVDGSIMAIDPGRSVTMQHPGALGRRPRRGGPGAHDLGARDQPATG